MHSMAALLARIYTNILTNTGFQRMENVMETSKHCVLIIANLCLKGLSKFNLIQYIDMQKLQLKDRSTNLLSS